ncbi:MAG: lipase maturation factor family protein, partial [Gammaproteobacteria bacterium]
MRAFFGRTLEPARYRRVAWLFSKLLACVFLIAFVSFAIQAQGLIGRDGILPVNAFFFAVQENLGPERYWWVPSLVWLSTSDAMLDWVCVAGMIGATLMLFHRLPAFGALLAYVAYLSLFHAGQTFMAFQWDLLLLECGALAVVMARHTRLGVWLCRLVMFRFMLLSGVVKLASGDPTWWSLTALDFHFETQPLPTALAWYADKLPENVLMALVAASLLTELVLPFFIFGPRRLRAVAVAGFAALQSAILVTGSYNFFNILTLILCLPLLDDRMLGWWRSELEERAPGTPLSRQAWRFVGAVFAILGALHLELGIDRESPRWMREIAVWSSPWHVVNGYGLFAVMTTERRELVVEGSRDGVAWRAYELPFKPGDPSRAPRLATPYQPRLDWQLWFAALTSRGNVPWINGLVVRTLL